MPASPWPTECPSPNELDAFHLGVLETPARFAQLAAHFEHCPQCLQQLEARATLASPWDVTLRSGAATPEEQTSPSYCDEPQFRDALRRIASIPQLSLATDAPQRIGDYEIQERLGAGGMGTVYKSWHPRLQRPVVLKLIRGRAAYETQAVAQFRDEMATLGRIDHPLIVKAYDAQEWEGREYLVMEYVAGLNLRQLVQRDGVFSAEDACALVHEAALGLAHLHQRGVVHRDIKPSNIALADDGRVKILDLGLALSVDDADRTAALDETTAPREGTLDFMSPEQYEHSRRVTAAADLFSLGATLHYLLVGESPWKGVDRRPDDPSTRVAAPKLDAAKLPTRLPRALHDCLGAMLASRPEDRPATALEVAARLRPFASRSQRIALTPLPEQQASQRASRVAVLALLFTVSSLLATLLLLNIDHDSANSRGDSTSSPSATPPGDAGGAEAGSAHSDDDDADASNSARRPFTAWRPGSNAKLLVGLAQFPPLFAEMVRWQVETVRPRGNVQGLAASPDGRHFAITSQDGAVRVFEVDDQRTAARLVRLLPTDAPSHDGARQLAWHPQGDRLALAVSAPDAPLVIWDWRESRKLFELRGHSAGVASIAWSPNGQFLGSVDGGGKLRLWDAEGLARHTATMSDRACSALAWHPDGRSLIVGDHAGRLARYTLHDQSMQVATTLLGGPILAVAWHPDGSELAAVTIDHRLHRLDGRSFAASTPNTPIIGEPFRALAWHGEKPTLTILTNSSRLVLDTRTNKLRPSPLASLRSTDWVAAATCLARQSFWIADTNGTVREYSDDDPPREYFHGPSTFPRDLAWNRTGTRLAVCAVDGCIQLWGGQGRAYGILQPSDPADVLVRCAAWSGDGRFLAAARRHGNGLVHVWDAESLEEVAVWRMDDGAGAIESLAWSDDGRWLVAVGDHGLVATWNVVERRPGPTLAAHQSARVNSVANCPHTRRFATGDFDKRICVWELDDAGAIHLLATWESQREPVWHLAWNSAGDRLAATGAGKSVWLLDAAAGREQWSFDCPIPPGRVVWKQDAERLYVNGGGMRDAATGALLDAGQLFLEPATMSPDGERLASISPTQLVTVHHPRSPIPRWFGIALAADSHVTFSPAGQVIYSTHPLEESLIYVVETRPGRFQTLRPSEFEKSIRRRISKL